MSCDGPPSARAESSALRWTNCTRIPHGPSVIIEVVLTPAEADEALRTLRGVVRGGSASQRDWWCRWLDERSAKELVRLDDRARATSWSAGSLGPSTEWTNVDLNRRDGLSAAIASLHPDGRLRERAVRVTKRRPRGPALPFLAMRVVDHVQQIRDAALEGLLDRTEVTDGQVCLPLLRAVSRRNHGLYALDTYGRALLDRHGVAAAVQLLDNSDLATRRAAYAVCLEQHALPLGVVWERIEAETDQFSKTLLIEHFIKSAPPSQVRNQLRRRACWTRRWGRRESRTTCSTSTCRRRPWRTGPAAKR